MTVSAEGWPISRPPLPRHRLSSRPGRWGLRAGLDPYRLHDLEDDLEAETFVTTTRKLRKALKK